MPCAAKLRLPAVRRHRRSRAAAGYGNRPACLRVTPAPGALDGAPYALHVAKLATACCAPPPTLLRAYGLRKSTPLPSGNARAGALDGASPTLRAAKLATACCVPPPTLPRGCGLRKSTPLPSGNARAGGLGRRVACLARRNWRLPVVRCRQVCCLSDAKGGAAFIPWRKRRGRANALACKHPLIKFTAAGAMAPAAACELHAFYLTRIQCLDKKEVILQRPGSDVSFVEQLHRILGE